MRILEREREREKKKYNNRKLSVITKWFDAFFVLFIFLCIIIHRERNREKELIIYLCVYMHKCNKHLYIIHIARALFKLNNIIIKGVYNRNIKLTEL